MCRAWWPDLNLGVAGFEFEADSVSHEYIDDQDYNDSTENDQPIGNLSARYRGFLVKPFHDFSFKIGRLSWRPLSSSELTASYKRRP